MICIHDNRGGFSDRWIEYCTRNKIQFERVNCLDPNIIRNAKRGDVFLWHWTHYSWKEVAVARQIIVALEKKEVLVFPNIATCGHFDDKIAQKYLLEAIEAPLIPTWVFTELDPALDWVEKTDWPKVFKLRCGAGSSNVRLVHSPSEARGVCRRAFGRGFAAVSGYMTDMNTRIRKTRTKKELLGKAMRAPRTLLNLLVLRRELPKQRGYVYFQEFVPNNNYDTRITVIGNRAFGFQRVNRPGDFRASGSGELIYNPAKIDMSCVSEAFRVANRLGTQSLAFDFLFGTNGKPLIGEISYCYMPAAVHACPGHWDDKLVWHEGNTWPQDAILQDICSNCL